MGVQCWSKNLRESEFHRDGPAMLGSQSGARNVDGTAAAGINGKFIASSFYERLNVRAFACPDLRLSPIIAVAEMSL